jgi:hypothetical protein
VKRDSAESGGEETVTGSVIYGGDRKIACFLEVVSREDKV